MNIINVQLLQAVVVGGGTAQRTENVNCSSLDQSARACVK